MASDIENQGKIELTLDQLLNGTPYSVSTSRSLRFQTTHLQALSQSLSDISYATSPTSGEASNTFNFSSSSITSRLVSRNSRIGNIKACRSAGRSMTKREPRTSSIDYLYKQSPLLRLLSSYFHVFTSHDTSCRIPSGDATKLSVEMEKQES